MAVMIQSKGLRKLNAKNWFGLTPCLKGETTGRPFDLPLHKRIQDNLLLSYHHHPTLYVHACLMHILFERCWNEVSHIRGNIVPYHVVVILIT